MALPFAIDGLEAAGNLFFGSATWAGLLFGLEEVAMFAAASYAYTSTLAKSGYSSRLCCYTSVLLASFRLFDFSLIAQTLLGF